MKDEYDFSNAARGKYSEHMRKHGYSVTVHREDGTANTRYYPPGVVPGSAPPVHVYPTRSGWAVRSETASRVARTSKTQEEAMKIGVEMASQLGAELVFHPRRLLLPSPV